MEKAMRSKLDKMK